MIGYVTLGKWMVEGKKDKEGKKAKKNKMYSGSTWKINCTTSLVFLGEAALFKWLLGSLLTLYWERGPKKIRSYSLSCLLGISRELLSNLVGNSNFRRRFWKIRSSFWAGVLFGPPLFIKDQTRPGETLTEN